MNAGLLFLTNTEPPTTSYEKKICLFFPVAYVCISISSYQVKQKQS